MAQVIEKHDSTPILSFIGGKNRYRVAQNRVLSLSESTGSALIVDCEML